jgi:6-phosphogluconolactonase
VSTETRVFDSVEELNAAAAEHIATAARGALEERGRFLFVLAGGNTPRGAYEQLVAQHAQEIDWTRVHVFWSDERCVAPAHAQSNYGMAADSLLQRVDVPAGNVHRIRGEDPPERAAMMYGRELAEFFRAAAPADLWSAPAFDLVLLGVGEDGHTASLFPGSPALAATGWAAPARVPEPAAVAGRVTLTLPAINAAREVLFLVAGAAKRQVVEQILRPSSYRGQGGAPTLPAARVRPRGRSRWFLDADAAGRSQRGEAHGDGGRPPTG